MVSLKKQTNSLNGMVDFKGSPYNFICGINVGKRRNRHRMILNLNLQSILSRWRYEFSFQIRSRTMSDPTLSDLRIKWLVSGLPLTEKVKFQKILKILLFPRTKLYHLLNERTLMTKILPLKLEILKFFFPNWRFGSTFFLLYFFLKL